MKTVLLLRHAKSSWDSPALNDYDRPLAKRGLRDAPRMGRALAASGVNIDLVISSGAARAQSTAKLVLKAADYKGEVRYSDAVYHASASELLNIIRSLDDKLDTVLFVGHNPGFEDLAGALVSEADPGAMVRFPTCALGCFDLAVDSWKNAREGRGQMLWLLVPKIL